MNKELKGQRYKTASGRESYEIYDAEPDSLQKIAHILQVQFGFRQIGDTVVGLDEVYMDFFNGEVDLVLGWDNWSGCFIHARQSAGDEVVITIGRYLDAVLNTL